MRVLFWLKELVKWLMCCKRNMVLGNLNTGIKRCERLLVFESWAKKKLMSQTLISIYCYPPPLLVCVLLSYLFNNLLRFGFCLSTVSCLFTFHTYGCFSSTKNTVKLLLLLLLFANAIRILLVLGHEAFANHFVVDAMVGTFGFSLWISSFEVSKSRIGQTGGYCS